jgi:DNA-binding NarL/FixJ family response regulator
MVPIKVLLVEDDRLLRELLAKAIEQSDDMVLVGSYDSAVEMLRFHYPPHAHRVPSTMDDVADIVVMDIWHAGLRNSTIRVPDSTEIYTFMRQVGIKLRALFVSSVSEDFVKGACYAIDPESWSYLDKSEIQSAKVVLDRIREQMTRGAA